MTGNQKEVVTTQQAAEMLGVSTTTVTRLVKRGLLIGYKLTPEPNSPLRITKASIKAYIDAHRPQ
jgi:excisionase family DNA binding protein